MKLLVMLAWRNLWRNKRRSILTMLAIIFSTFLTVFMRGIGIGTWEFNVRNSLELFSGYLQLQRSGYQENPSLQKSFAYPAAVESVLRDQPTIAGYAPRIIADGLMSYRETSSGAALFGIDPLREQHLFRFHERLNSGSFLNPTRSHEIVVGYKLLRNLGAAIGDTIVMLAQGYDGTLGNMRYRIAGTMKFGIPEFDAMMVFMLLPDAQELLGMEGRVNIAAISVAGLNDIEPARRAILKRMRADKNNHLALLTWDEVMPDLKQAMEFDTIGDWIFLWVLIIVVAFGILNTILMSVTERFREFGISLAIGVQPGTLVRLVFIEIAFLAVIGIIVGGVIGQALNACFTANPITFTGQFAEFYEQYGFIPKLIAVDRPTIPLTVGSFMMFICLLSAIYPAYRVATLAPLKGIRYT